MGRYGRRTADKRFLPALTEVVPHHTSGAVNSLTPSEVRTLKNLEKRKKRELKIWARGACCQQWRLSKRLGCDIDAFSAYCYQPRLTTSKLVSQSQTVKVVASVVQRVGDSFCVSCDLHSVLSSVEA